MNISTLAPIRNACYEFFVVQHILTFFGFIVAMMIHLPTTALHSRIYIYIPVGIYLVDRLIRTAFYLDLNIGTNRATLTKLPGGVTKVRTRCAKIKSWKPGTHIIVSFPALAFGQSHPATIASSPQSHGGDIILLLKRHRGFTKTLFDNAKLDASDEAYETDCQKGGETHRILIDGPYGGRQGEFAAFESVCLIAGSTGITFILSNLLAMAHSTAKTNGKLPLRRIHVVWAVKEAVHLEWVRNDLVAVLAELGKSGVEVNLSLFITQDSSWAKSGRSQNYTAMVDRANSPPSSLTQSTADTESGGATVEKGEVAAWSAQGGLEPSVQSGRPQLDQVLEGFVRPANGDCGIAVCGPLGMSVSVRNAVAGRKSNIYLHVEGFAF